MTKRSDAELALDLTLVAVVGIACAKCQKEDSISLLTSDADDAARCFYDNGWRVVKELVLCRKCRRKR